MLYSLYGVVEHSGRLSSGHYTAYVKVRSTTTGDDKLLSFLQEHDLPHAIRLQDLYEAQCKHQTDGADKPTTNDDTMPSAGKWFHISDSNVSETSEASVLRCQAYMMFYERVL